MLRLTCENSLRESTYYVERWWRVTLCEPGEADRFRSAATNVKLQSTVGGTSYLVALRVISIR